MHANFDYFAAQHPHWMDKCDEALYARVLEENRRKLVFALVRNQLVVCRSSYADESQMARAWVDELGADKTAAIDALAEHLTKRELTDQWDVRFWSQR